MKKKLIRKKKVSQICRVLQRTVLFCFIFGLVIPAYGKEREKGEAAQPSVVVTEIRHRHMGNAGEQGGCYTLPIMHQHQGNEKEGGSCYEREVYHVHQGEKGKEGGCFTKPVFHIHKGNRLTGGECFEAVRHTHVESCYSQEECVVYHTIEANVTGAWQQSCFEHGMTTFVSSNGIAVHESCGAGEQQNVYRYCQKCGFLSPTSHFYQKVICGMEEEAVTGYREVCGKDETTVEEYEADCGIQEGGLEKYTLSCDKTIEGYDVGCGYTENQLCGKMILENETSGQAQQVVLRVSIEDYTGGKLQTETPPYEWRDENGSLLGTEDSIVVKENGIYFVRLRLVNRDVNEAGLCSSILVGNIDTSKPQQSPLFSPEKTAPPDGQAVATPAAAGEEGNTDEGDSGEESAATPGSSPVNTPVTAQIPRAFQGKGKDTQKPAGQFRKIAAEQELVSTPSPVFSAPPVRKESRTVTPKKNQAREEIPYVVKQEEKYTGFFTAPAVKIVSITGASLLFAVSLILFLFYLRRSVRVFNDNGEGRMLRLGRCPVKTKEGRDTVTITDTMVEKAYTNRYCIRPGLFLLGKREGQELIVYKDEKKVSVYLCREMIVIL